MKTIVIFYEFISREFESCERIKTMLENIYGYNVHVFSWHFQKREFFDLTKKVVVDVLIIPFAYSQEEISPFYIPLKNKRINKILDLRHEQICVGIYDNMVYPKDDLVKKYVYHISWTDVLKTEMIKHGVSPNRILVTQSARSDLLVDYKIDKTREEVAQKYGLNPNKKWIMLAESGRELDIQTINELVRRGCERDEVIKLSEIMKEGIEETERQLNSLVSTFFDQFEIIYRPHPGTKCEGKFASAIKIIGDESMYFWLDLVDIIISRYSTALFEAQAKGKLGIRFEVGDIEAKYIPLGLNEIPRIQRIEDIQYKQEDVDNQAYRKYIGNCDGKSIKSISREISKLASQENNDFEDYNFHIGIKDYVFYWRNYFSNLLSYVICVKDMKCLSRFSKSTKVFGKDIPPQWKQ